MDARDTDPIRFDDLVARYRPEIQVHCYRMLGSFQDAEDLAQETLLFAWRGLAGFEGRSSVRTWLYRIATNACLRALSRRTRAWRVMPDAAGSAVGFSPLGPPDTETAAWLEPYPDTALEGIADEALGPEAHHELGESVRLAFVAAVQILPARQRAVLLLRDVLGFSAAETAAIVESSVPSVNSALQRARLALRSRVDAQPPAPVLAPGRERQLLDRYLTAWNSGDLEGLVAVLREDVVWTMPPWREWYVGRGPVRSFLAWAMRPDGRRHRLVVTAANGQPAFGHYRSSTIPGGWQAFAIQVLSVGPDSIDSIANFVDAGLFPAFGLPLTTDDSGRPSVSEEVG